MGGLPYRIGFHINHCKALPAPKLNGAGQKRMSVQVHHLNPGVDGQRMHCAVQRSCQPRTTVFGQHKQAYDLHHPGATIIELRKAPVVGQIAD